MDAIFWIAVGNRHVRIAHPKAYRPELFQSVRCRFDGKTTSKIPRAALTSRRLHSCTQVMPGGAPQLQGQKSR